MILSRNESQNKKGKVKGLDDIVIDYQFRHMMHGW